MLIIVASGNIFRREFSSYVLSDAGYLICEVRNLEGLLALLRARLPTLLLIDTQLGQADPAAALRAIRAHSAAPILWIADQPRPGEAELCPSDVISWPFQEDELLATVVALLEGSGIDLADLGRRERYAGSSE